MAGYWSSPSYCFRSICKQRMFVCTCMFEFLINLICNFYGVHYHDNKLLTLKNTQCFYGQRWREGPLKKMRPIYIQPSWPNKLGQAQLIKDLLHGQNKIFSCRIKQVIPASFSWSPSIKCKLYDVHCMLVCVQALEWNDCDILCAVFAIQVWRCKTLFPVKAYNLKVNGNLE